MHFLALLFALASSLSPASDNFEPDFARDQYADIYGGRKGAYDTAYCPNGYRIQYCEFDPDACDNTSQGGNFCGADSRNNGDCRFHGRCVRRTKQVNIEGGRRDSQDTAYCPSGFHIQSCSFDTGACGNIRQGLDYCSAGSRNHQYCHFTGVCVSN